MSQHSHVIQAILIMPLPAKGEPQGFAGALIGSDLALNGRRRPGQLNAYFGGSFRRRLFTPPGRADLQTTQQIDSTKRAVICGRPRFPATLGRKMAGPFARSITDSSMEPSVFGARSTGKPQWLAALGRCIEGAQHRINDACRSPPEGGVVSWRRWRRPRTRVGELIEASSIARWR